MIPIARQNEYEFPSNNHSLKTQVKERKPSEWSEKDKIIIEGACNALKIYGHTKLASMLESLRPQKLENF